MAWAISNNLAAHRRPIEFFMPTTSGAFTAADVTTWSGAFSLPARATKFRAVVLVKNYLAGAVTGNFPNFFTLDAADSAGFSNNHVIVDTKAVFPIDGQLGVATARIHHFVLEGQLLNTDKAFAAVFFRTPTVNGNFGSFGAATFDVWLDAT